MRDTYFTFQSDIPVSRYTKLEIDDVTEREVTQVIYEPDRVTIEITLGDPVRVEARISFTPEAWKRLRIPDRIDV